MLCLSYHNFLNNTRWKHWSIKVQGQSFYDIWKLKSYIKIFYSWPHNFQCKKIFILIKNCRFFHFHFLENKIFIYLYTSNKYWYKFMKVLCIRCEKLKLKSWGPPTINVRPSDEGVTRHHQKLSLWWAIQICVLRIQNTSKKSLEFQNLAIINAYG